MRTLKLLVVVLGLAATAQADSYGAIAWSRSTGQTGWSWGFQDQGSAEQAAVGACNSPDCGSIVWANGTCVAVAVEGGRPFWGSGSDEGLARAEALGYCGEGHCKIVASVCSSF